MTIQRLVTLVSLVALFIPQTLFAEPLLVFFKDDSNSATSWQQTPQNKQKAAAATLGLNENGDLVVKYRSVQMVFAYCPPEDPHSHQEVPRINMASSQDVPPINGLSVKLHLVF